MSAPVLVAPDPYAVAERAAGKAGARFNGGAWLGGRCPLTHGDVKSARLDIHVIGNEVVCRCSAGCAPRAVLELLDPSAARQVPDDGDPGPIPPPPDATDTPPAAVAAPPRPKPRPAEPPPVAPTTPTVPAVPACAVDLPEHLVPWRDGAAPTPSTRPRLTDPAAFIGLAGDVALGLEPYTEADPGAMLVTYLTAFGAALNRGPHMLLDGSHHPGRLFTVLVGDTSRGRKGTSWARVLEVLLPADEVMFGEKVLGGFGSGEAVVDAIADPNGEDQPGATDKRLLLHDPEFSRTLKSANRDGSTLSEQIRDAWDGSRLQVRSRAKTSVATNPHVALLGHVTLDPLRRHLCDEDIVNGFANRLLFIAVGRSKLLPEGRLVPAEMVKDLQVRSRTALVDGRKIPRVAFGDDVRDRWAEFYRACANDPGGLIGAITARGEPMVARLALLYAVLEGERTIAPHHLEAGLAVWAHSEATCRWVWGDREGDPLADRLLAAIRTRGADGLSLSEQSAALGRNASAAVLETIRTRLERRELIVTGRTSTDGVGRPPVHSVAVMPATNETKETK